MRSDAEVRVIVWAAAAFILFVIVLVGLLT